MGPDIRVVLLYHRTGMVTASECCEYLSEGVKGA